MPAHRRSWKQANELPLDILSAEINRAVCAIGGALSPIRISAGFRGGESTVFHWRVPLLGYSRAGLRSTGASLKVPVLTLQGDLPSKVTETMEIRIEAFLDMLARSKKKIQ